ncbi:MAG TPA: phosphatidate cytidylyltransferase [Polyangiaceae bacterium]|jgi:phosphatidate cytidylyltransferase
MAGAASNLAMRLATAAVGVPAVLVLLYAAPPWVFYVVILGTTLVGTLELLAMSHPQDRVSQWIGVALALAASAVVYFRREDPHALLALLAAFPLVALLVTLARLGAIETAALRAFAMAAGPPLVAVPLALLAALRSSNGGRGSGAVLLAIGLAWFADTGAYFAGRFAGRHKLYEAVSPKKTVEGAVGGLAASVLWALLGAFLFVRGSLPPSHAVWLGLVAGALGQAGDLGESLLKRSTGVKDSGNIVPGHGGILDRVDALLMTSVAVYFYARWADWL